MCYGKQKKKKLVLIISGVVLLAIVGAIIYFAWPKKEANTENKQPTNSKEEIQRLQTQLSSLKQKINNLSDNTKKTQLENKLTNTESQVSNLSNQKSVQKSTIKKLEKEIEEIKKELEGDKPDKPKDNPPQDKPNPDRNDKPNDKDNPPEPDPQPDDNNKGWNYVATKINDNTFKYWITLDGRQVDFNSFTLFLRGEDKDFLKAFQGALKDANSKFPAYFWKCPPVSLRTLTKPFEFVVIKSDTLNNIKQDWTSFGEHISPNHQKWACSFPSKSGSSTLIIPIPKPGPELDFKNISQFTKNAPEEQQQELWKEVANKLMEELDKNPDAPRWLNTEGTGVYYLHVRIDKKNGFYSNYPEYAKWE